MTTGPIMFNNILVTGGAGFIGSNFIRYLFNQPDFQGGIINYDALTYAGNLGSLADIDESLGGRRYHFRKGDINDVPRVLDVLRKFAVDAVVHFAAESHVDRSINDPASFVRTNVMGTFSLLEAVRAEAREGRAIRFHHVSTDEVYGSLGAEGSFYESTPYDPRSPYSAGKASSDHFVRAYFHTYDLPVTISNCSNNYGPYQFPEKLIPVMLLNMLEGKPLPVYGDGRNIRDWLYVDDHNSAVWTILKSGKIGETYNIGGECEVENINLIRRLCETAAELTNASAGKYLDLITYVKDRPGHDRRYSINCDKIKKELGWSREFDLESGLRATIRWYLANGQWVDDVRHGEYRKWIEKNYGER